MVKETPWLHDSKWKVLTVENASGTTPTCQQGNANLLWKKIKNIKITNAESNENMINSTIFKQLPKIIFNSCNI
jgi:hypothetical protein